MNAKILFCHPPPGVSEVDFNKRTHEIALLRAAGKKRAPTTHVGKDADTFIPANAPTADGTTGANLGLKTKALDQDFFANNSNLSARPFIQAPGQDGREFTRSRLYPHQNSVADDGTPLPAQKTLVDTALANVNNSGKRDTKSPDA